MRLLYVLNTFAVGGRERRCLQLIQGLIKYRDYQITVVVIDGDIEYHELFDCNISIVTLHRLERHKSPAWVFFEVRRIFYEFKPQVVHGWGCMATLCLLPLRLFHKFGFISTIANTVSPSNFLTKFENWASCRLCDNIVSNSLAGLHAYSVPNSKAVCIYNGFNEERFSRIADSDTLRHDLHIESQYVVAMIASFQKTKDWQCFIDAARIVSSHRPDISFLSIGQGPNWNNINNQLSEMDRRTIKMLGKRDDVDELLQIVDVSVLCSNVNTKESLSNTILESMAWGVPVIATAGGGTSEILQDAVNGLLIHSQNPETVARMIENLIDDDNLRQRLAVAAKQTVQQRFLLTDKVVQYDELYKSVYGR